MNDREQGLSFPLTFLMKIIMHAETVPGENRRRIEAVFNDLGLPHTDWRQKESGAGKYTSYSVNLTADSREVFYHVHEKLAKVPGVRYVI
jgi:putative lipoic acid-binding regulatory protein